MSNYPPPPPNTTAPPPSGYPYSTTVPPQPNPYGAPVTSSPYPSTAPPNPYGPPVTSSPYPTTTPPQPNPYAPPPSMPPPQQYNPYAPYGHPSPFASLAPSAFPPGTDPNLVACFHMSDQDRSGFIDDVELQRALSSYNQAFSMRTVHLLMYNFTNTNVRKIGPKEFTQVYYSLQNWRAIFERFDRDRSGKIDAAELRDALLSLGFSVSPAVLDLLVSKFDKTGGKHKAIEYDNFIECCLTVKGLTEKFKEKDTSLTGSATFNYEAFMATVLPFIIA